jgi:hypothetical protein
VAYSLFQNSVTNANAGQIHSSRPAELMDKAGLRAGDVLEERVWPREQYPSHHAGG